VNSILSVDNIKKHYELSGIMGKKGTVKAVDGVSFELQAGKTLAVVGESGCGKSTLAKVLMGIESITDGKYMLNGKPFQDFEGKEFRKIIQMIFQDPYSSINPRKKAWQIIAEPLFVNSNLSKAECRARVLEVMNQVGLRPEMADRYPHMFSGGQRQRIGIARALVLNPKILICDEPVSALDVSVQAQVLNLLMDLQDNLKLSYVFISHDLSVVKHISDDVLVMYLGRIVEYGDRKSVFDNPQHPYTKALLASTPDAKKGKLNRERPLMGELPSPLAPPPGCAFQTRCPLKTDRCTTEVPVSRTIEGRTVACHNL
jgi:dipeptide transport system ATP-binding protein